VIWADHIAGPWSAPIDLHLPDHIDPGHAVGEDGSRWLFLSGGDRVRLADDGLSTVGAVQHVYDPWHYPPDWDVEGFSPEGPKIVAHGGWFYLITAVGGTAGPPTGHMVIAARSRSIHGPWENCPHNPIVRTRSREEAWWSRGHATLVQGPGGDWWSVYHGYERDYWTLGRQTLLDPVEWTADGWFRMRGGDLSTPLPAPRGAGSPARMACRCPTISPRWNWAAAGISSSPARTRHAVRASPITACIWPRAARHRPIPPPAADCRGPGLSVRLHDRDRSRDHRRAAAVL
jgi:beta-xylosidase